MSDKVKGRSRNFSLAQTPKVILRDEAENEPFIRVVRHKNKTSSHTATISVRGVGGRIGVWDGGSSVGRLE
jgi:hypothetical protein